MNLGFFYTPNQQEKHRIAIKSLYHGASQQENCFISYDSEYVDCDIAVTWSIYKEKLPYTITRKVIHDTQIKLNKKIIVIEMGYIHRDRYYSVGYNSQNGWADFKNINMPPDRWNALDVDLKDFRKGGDHILLCGQVPWDTAVQHVDYKKWCKEIVQQIKQHTDRPIIFRPHPLAHESISEIEGAETSNKETLKQDLKNCHAVVGFNSNALVEALIEGYPVFACDSGAMTKELSNNLKEIENPKFFDRQQWANNLAYSQWTLGEMANGATWNHLK